MKPLMQLQAIHNGWSLAHTWFLFPLLERVMMVSGMEQKSFHSEE
jgi:hypothetical protein